MTKNDPKIDKSNESGKPTNLTGLAIENKWLTLALLLVVFVLGIKAYQQMPRDDMPPFKIRFLSIVAPFPGASPARVEMLVTDKIEKVVQEVPEVDYIASESRANIAVITVALKDSVPELRPVFDAIRRKVEDMAQTLPEGVHPEIKDEVGDVYGILLGITGDGYTPAELKNIADDVKDALIKLPDAAKVEISGNWEERVYIDYDNAKLAEMGLSKNKVQAIVAATNIIFPGGDLKIGDERVILEPTGNFESVEELKRTIVSPAGAEELVYLGDVTHIYRDYVQPRDTIVRINGIEGLVVGINLKKGGNLIRLGRDVDRLLGHFKRIYPIGVEFLRVASQDVVVEKSVSDFIGNLLQSVGVVLFTMLIFLGLRTGLVVAGLIPSAIVLTLLLMSLCHVGLNKVSLASLIIALGMLVDNAIVMSESVMVKMAEGMQRIDAAVASAAELMVPLLVSTLTTAAAFLSFYLAESVMGEIMGRIFVVVSLALLSSWVMSLTVIPLFSVFFIRVEPQDNAEKAKTTLFERLMAFYRKLLDGCLNYAGWFSLGILVVFIFSLWLFRFLPFIFFPDSDRPVVSVNIEFPLGTDIEVTDQAVADVETYIRQNLTVNEDRPEGVLSWSAYIGKGAPKYDLGYNPPESSPNAAHMLLNTTSDLINDSVINKIDRFCFDRFPDVTAKVGRLVGGGGSADPIAIRVNGRSADRLYDIVASIETKLNSIPGTKNVYNDWGQQSKKIIVRINPIKAQYAGLSHQDIAQSLYTALSGAEISKYREGDLIIPIIMRNSEKANKNIETLESFNIYAQNSGRNVPLKQVADIQVVWEASKILRRDLYRTMTVKAGLKQGVTAAAVMDRIEPWLEQEQHKWGAGYTYTLGGEAEDSKKNMGAVADNLPLSFFVILLLLIGQFNSLKKPLIVLATIPLGLIGVILGLLVMRSYFGFMGFLGVISLAGIVINNAIVLLDRVQIEITEFKKPAHQALIDAACQRFRPILLTTATTSLGLIPLWIGGGVMWRPMAIGIIFGLLFATVITLLFVPALYKILYRV